VSLLGARLAVKQRFGHDEIAVDPVTSVARDDMLTSHQTGKDEAVSTRRPTLADVAARAGVAPSTASYVLNGRAEQMRISAPAQERVRQAIADLGYRPNRSARNLRTARTRTFGLISDYVATGEFASRMLAGASQAAREGDHLIVIGESQGDPDLEHQLIEEMIDRQVDGLIYITRTATRITIPAALAGQRAVLLNCHDPASDLPSVLPDDEEGGRTAARLVLGSGRAGSTWVVGHDPNPAALAGPRRVRGISAEFDTAQVQLGGQIDCDWRVADAFAATTKELSNGLRPTALICMNDRVAMGVHQALTEQGLAVGTDVAVVSFDGSSLATWLRPAVTSVALPFAELGAAAVRLLLDPPGPGTVVMVPMPVTWGRSL
jgi:LacI family transcriptional regulator